MWYANSMKKVLVVIVAILVFGFMYYSINYIDNGLGIYGNPEEYNEKFEKLEFKKRELEVEQSKYNVDDCLIEGRGSLVFIISDTNAGHLSWTVPTLNDNGYISVVALSKEHMPEKNDPEFFNRSDIEKLAAKGYEFVISLGKNDNAIETYNYFVERNYDIKGFYIPFDNVSEDTINDIRGIGNMTIFGNISGFDYEDEEEELNVFNTYGYKLSNIKSNFIDAVNSSGTIAISVGSLNDYELYDKTSFDNMISYIKPYIDDSSIVLTNVGGAVERKESYQIDLNELKNITQQKFDEIQEQIDEIEFEMLAIYE